MADEPRTYVAFAELVTTKAASVPENTLRLWWHIYQWMQQHGYADTADSPEFVRYVGDFRRLTTQSVNSHLRRMTAAGLLVRYRLRRKLTKEDVDLLHNPFTLLLGNGVSDLPTTFNRFTIPGRTCCFEFKSAARALEKHDKFMDGLRALPQGVP